jgi:hypothetical protein
MARNSTKAEPRTGGNRDVTRIIGTLLMCQARLGNRGQNSPSFARVLFSTSPVPGRGGPFKRLNRWLLGRRCRTDFAHINICGIRVRQHEKLICIAIGSVPPRHARETVDWETALVGSEDA